MHKPWLFRKFNQFHDGEGRFTYGPEGRGGGGGSVARENMEALGKPALNWDSSNRAAWITPGGKFVQGDVHSLLAASVDPSKYSNDLKEVPRFGADTGAVRIRWGVEGDGSGEMLISLFKKPQGGAAGSLRRAVTEFYDHAPEGKVIFEALDRKGEPKGHAAITDPRRYEGALKRVLDAL